MSTEIVEGRKSSCCGARIEKCTTERWDYSKGPKSPVIGKPFSQQYSTKKDISYKCTACGQVYEPTSEGVVGLPVDR